MKPFSLAYCRANVSVEVYNQKGDAIVSVRNCSDILLTASWIGKYFSNYVIDSGRLKAEKGLDDTPIRFPRQDLTGPDA